MTPILSSAGLALQDLVLAATKTKSSSSSFSTLIFLVFIVAIGYFLLIRPQRNRARKSQQQQQQIEIGDEVMLSSGIIGTVLGMEGDRATVEIADGVEIEVVRRALAQRLTQTAAEPMEEEAEEEREVGPDPATFEHNGEYNHPSDETYGIPHGLHSPGPDDGGGSEAADGADHIEAAGNNHYDAGAVRTGTDGALLSQPPVSESKSGAAAADVPRVPGGGLGDAMEPDGPAGKE